MRRAQKNYRGRQGKGEGKILNTDIASRFGFDFRALYFSVLVSYLLFNPVRTSGLLVLV